MKPRTKVVIGYGAIFLWMFWPLLYACIASVIAASCDCKLNETNAHPCVVFGVDVGETLYAMFLIVFVTGGTFLTGILALLVFTAMIVWSRS